MQLLTSAGSSFMYWSPCRLMGRGSSPRRGRNTSSLQSSFFLSPFSLPATNLGLPGKGVPLLEGRVPLAPLGEAPGAGSGLAPNLGLPGEGGLAPVRGFLLEGAGAFFLWEAP